MLRRLVPLLVVFCAACAPAALPQVIYVTAGPIGPAELVRLSDIATNTAIAVATQAAYATASEEVAAQRATAAHQATQDALQAQQTTVALESTRQAVLVAATDQAAGKTQAAGQTQAWATPTWAALRTMAAAERVGIAATATQISVASDRARAGADGYRNLWGAAVVVGTLALVVLSAIALHFYFEREQARLGTVQQTESEKADRERLATERAAVELERARLELLKSMMVERDGQPWVIAPGGRLLPMLPGGVATVSQGNQGHTWRWRVACKKAVYAGIAKTAEKGVPQFGERDLAGREPGKCWVINPDGAPSSTGYRHINRILRRLGIWTTSGRETTWGREWDEERFEREFDQLPLPDLPPGEPPDVRIPPRNSTISAVTAISTVPRSE